MKASASLVKNWMACSMQAKFSYVERLPQVNSAAASFGSAVHLALELYNNGNSVQDAKDCFTYVWDHLDEFGWTPEIWPPRTSYGSYRERGLKFIDMYHEDNKWIEKTIIGTEHRFHVPFGRHTLSGVVDLLEHVHGSDELRCVDFKSGFRPNAENLRQNVQFCADQETEILTRRGWKKYDELIVGEEVLTFNSSRDVSEWQPATSINVFDAHDQELVLLSGKAHSSLTTKNHRWFVNHTVSSRNGFRVERRIVTSEQLTGSDSIPCAAPTINLPIAPKYSDEFVRLVAWFWTEGHVIKGGSLSFAQSERVNPENVRMIRSTLTELYGPASESLRSLPYAAWRESAGDDCNRFYLNRTASEQVAVVFDDYSNKILSSRFISDLTETQLRDFIEVSLLADGSRQNHWIITQSVRSRLDPFQMACSLAGIRTSLRRRAVRGNGPYAGRELWELSLKERERFYVPSKPKRSIVKYTGKVWCPTTANQTWLARREGHVYFTGNTIYTYAIQQKQFWTGDPDNLERYPGFENGEELWAQYKDLTPVAVWYDLRNSKGYNVGPRTERDYARLQLCLDNIERAMELEVYVPNISGDTCGVCSYKDQCPAYVSPE